MIWVLALGFVMLFEFFELFLDDVADHLLRWQEQRGSMRFFREFLVFIFDLVSFKACQLIEAQIEDGIGLSVGKVKVAIKSELWLRRGCRLRGSV